MKKVKVVELVPTLGDGGAETLVKDYALMIDKSKFDITLITLWKTPESVNSLTLKKSGLREIHIYNNYALITRAWNKFFGKFYVPLKLRFLLKKEKPDCLHIHLHLLQHVKKISDNLRGISLFFTCHSEVSEHFESNEEISTLQYLVDNCNLKLIALHERMRRELNAKFGTDNAVVINNGVDFNRFRNVEISKEDIRKSLGIPENAFVIGHVGRFTECKNHNLIVKIFIELKKRRSDTYLLLVGSGKLKDDIRLQLNKANFTGSFQILSMRTDIPVLLKTMDVFVFPSLYEGLSVALVEAQASGLRCVVSDKIDKANFLTANMAAVGVNDLPEKWVSEILSDSKLSEYGNLQDFDMNRSIRKLEKLYAKEIT